LIGIGINISGFAITLIYAGFHHYKEVGIPSASVLGVMMCLNLFLQLTPCYMQDKYEKLRMVFYIAMVALLLGVAIAWAVFFSTPLEFSLFFWRIMLSFLFLGLGFFFYITKYPERASQNYYV
jgi:predicted membrane channel-forming protein YqfA (hemolysin III family)